MASEHVVVLTSANWEQEVVNSPVPVLVDFWATWCQPCRRLLPTIEKLAEQYKGKVKVCKLNTDENQEIAVRYGISGLPIVLIFKGSEDPVGRIIGNRPEEEYVRELTRILEA